MRQEKGNILFLKKRNMLLVPRIHQTDPGLTAALCEANARLKGGVWMLPARISTRTPGCQRPHSTQYTVSAQYGEKGDSVQNIAHAALPDGRE
jgi:hypothetical protein